MGGRGGRDRARSAGAGRAAARQAAPLRGGLSASKGKGSSGKPFACQASKPPWRGRTRVIPIRLSWSATRALVASLGQLQ